MKASERHTTEMERETEAETERQMLRKKHMQKDGKDGELDSEPEWREGRRGEG